MRGFGNDFKTAPQSTFDNSVCKEGMICAFPLEKRTGRKKWLTNSGEERYSKTTFPERSALESIRSIDSKGRIGQRFQVTNLLEDQLCGD